MLPAAHEESEQERHLDHAPTAFLPAAHERGHQQRVFDHALAVFLPAAHGFGEQEPFSPPFTLSSRRHRFSLTGRHTGYESLAGYLVSARARLLRHHPQRVKARRAPGSGKAYCLLERPDEEAREHALTSTDVIEF
jgi:hypothetical protein